MAIPKEIIRAEKKLVKLLYTSFKGLAQLLASSIEGGELDNDIIMTLHFDKLIPDILKEIESVYKNGAKRIKKEMDLETDFSYVIEKARSFARYKEYELSQSTIAVTTKKWVAEIVSKGVEEGKSYTEIAKEIKAQSKKWLLSKARAQLIAVRESGDAYENGRRETIFKHVQQTGEGCEKIWDTVGDDRVTQWCRDNEAKGWILFNELRPSGDETAPRNGNPRCRCTTNYRLI